MDLEKLIKKYVKNTKSDWNYITPIDFYTNYYSKPNMKKTYILIDLRKQTDYKKSHIKGAKNIFWLDLFDSSNLKKLPKDKKIFLICYVGHTSSQVMTLLKLLDYDVVSIKFGYGLSPVKRIPIAGWVDYGLPITSSIKK